MNKRTHKHEKLVRVYDDEILPIWSQRFGRMMMQRVEAVPHKAMVLDVSCGTGFATLELARKVDPTSRIIAIDASSAMLEVARKKAGDMAGKRIFFRTETATPKLSFADEVYDLVTCNLGLGEFSDPRQALHEFARVAKVGGVVVATLPLRGTWGEFYDIYREVLTKHDKHEMLTRLDAHLESQLPEPETAIQWMERSGLEDVKLDVEEFSLLFRSSREFFFAPVIEYGPLASWKEIAGTGKDLQDVFWYIKQAIDAYFGDRAFQATVKAGCLRGIKRATTPAELAAEREDAIDLVTGEVELDELEEVEDDGGDEELAGQPMFAAGSGHGPNDLRRETGEIEVTDDAIESTDEEIEAFALDATGKGPVSIPDLLEGSGFERSNVMKAPTRAKASGDQAEGADDADAEPLPPPPSAGDAKGDDDAGEAPSRRSDPDRTPIPD